MKVRTERIDHLGIVSGVIKDLGLIDLIDDLVGSDKRQEITVGEAIAGTILNGLGFSDRPVSLTPQFFESKAMELLFRDGATAGHFKRTT